MIVVAVVAVIDVEKRAHAAAGEAHPAAILLQPALGLGVDQVDARLVDLLDGDGRLARLHLAGNVRVQLVERRLRQIDGLRQIDRVKLLQVEAQHRIDLRLRADRLQRVDVAHALGLRQAHRQQHQRRIEALRRLLLQVRPAQKADHQPQLGEAVLGLIAAGLVANLVELAGQVQRLLEAQILVERDLAARGDRVLEVVAPGQDLLGTDVLHVERQRHRRPGEIHRLRRGAEVQQAIAPRNLEEPLLQAGQDRAHACRGGRRC